MSKKDSQYKPVQVSGCDVADNRYRWGDKVWLVSNLIERAKGLGVFDLPLQAINSGTSVWSPIESAYELAKAIKRVNETSFEYPVIMDQEGFIMDGWHRVAKALVEGRTTIKAVRFDKTPDCDFEEKSE
jgi:hypothetical protein